MIPGILASKPFMSHKNNDDVFLIFQGISRNDGDGFYNVSYPSGSIPAVAGAYGTATGEMKMYQRPKILLSDSNEITYMCIAAIDGDFAICTDFNRYVAITSYTVDDIKNFTDWTNDEHIAGVDFTLVDIGYDPDKRFFIKHIVRISAGKFIIVPEVQTVSDNVKILKTYIVEYENSNSISVIESTIDLVSLGYSSYKFARETSTAVDTSEMTCAVCIAIQDDDSIHGLIVSIDISDGSILNHLFVPNSLSSAIAGLPEINNDTFSFAGEINQGYQKMSYRGISARYPDINKSYAINTYEYKSVDAERNEILTGEGVEQILNLNELAIEKLELLGFSNPNSIYNMRITPFVRP